MCGMLAATTRHLGGLAQNAANTAVSQMNAYGASFVRVVVHAILSSRCMLCILCMLSKGFTVHVKVSQV